jgi:hypothetical protein
VPTLDQLAVPALLLVLVFGGMRLFYGAWPWEASKTWYRTRQAVAYVESMRAEKKAAPALRLTEEAEDNSAKVTIKDEAETSTTGLIKDATEAEAALRQVLDSIRGSADTFDRSYDSSAPEVSAQSSEPDTARKS